MKQKKQKKTEAQKAADRLNLVEAIDSAHERAFDVVQEFREYYTMYDCDIAMIPAGVISQIMAITGFEIRSAEERCSQDYVAAQWSEDTTASSVYEKGGDA